MKKWIYILLILSALPATTREATRYPTQEAFSCVAPLGNCVIAPRSRWSL